jgi:exoribonuclease-2
MYLIFEEDGHFKAGSILSETDATAQVETASGKRSKIKTANILLRFAAPAPAEVMQQAETLAAELDADFLWEAAGSDEFGFAELAQEYYGHAPTPPESVALLQKLHASPIYFHKRGRGRYRPAPAETLAAAKAGVEKKRLAAERQAHLAAELAAFRLPEEYASLVPRILIAPDKNTLEYKALEDAAAATGLSPLRLIERCGAIPSTLDFHLATFLLEYFPRGTGFADITEPAALNPSDPPELPRSTVRAFSMDDEATTEIDDALSVEWRDDGSVRVGIHIAAPALGITPGSELDRVARERLSTVYYPGDKITMLPDALIHHYTLGETHDCPALSLYVDVAPDLRVLGTESRLEMVHIADNLRHETLEVLFNDDTLKNPDVPDYPYRRELEWLRDFAAVLEAGRGKTDTVDRVDYNFKVDGERISIVPRKRGSPIDKVVSELMIFANAHWGGWLAEKKGAGDLPRAVQRQDAHDDFTRPARRPRRRPICVVVVAAATLCRPGQPAPVDQPGAGQRSGLSAAQRAAVFGGARIRAGLRCLQRIPAADGALLDAALAAAGKHPGGHRQGHPRRPGALRHAAAGDARAVGDGRRPGRAGAAGDFEYRPARHPLSRRVPGNPGDAA